MIDRVTFLLAVAALAWALGLALREPLPPVPPSVKAPAALLAERPDWLSMEEGRVLRTPEIPSSVPPIPDAESSETSVALPSALREDQAARPIALELARRLENAGVLTPRFAWARRDEGWEVEVAWSAPQGVLARLGQALVLEPGPWDVRLVERTLNHSPGDSELGTRGRVLLRFPFPEVDPILMEKEARR